MTTIQNPISFPERKELETAAARLAAIVESSEDAIVGKDLQGTVSSWNKGAEKMFGYSTGEMVGHSITRLIPPERRQEEEAILSRIRLGENVPHFETVRVRKDGNAIHVSVTVSPIKDANGNVVGASKVARDITERKRAEEALRASEARLRQVTDNARVGLVMVNCERQYTFANATYSEILALPSWDLVGQRVADVLAPLYEPQIRPHLDRAFAGERVAYELRRPTPDQDRYYTVKYEPTGVGGTVSQVVVVITDITDRKQAEEACRESEARYRTLFEYAPDGIVIANSEGCYTDANASLCRMLGYTREEMITLSGRDIVAPDEIPQIEPALSEIKGRSDYHREWKFRRKDGSVFPTEVSATTTPDGKIMGLIRDITERKKAEDEIRRLNSELERRVIERTAQLEAANKELEAFSYSVSHDLRAPLRAVDGFSQAVLEDYGPQLPPEGRKDLQTIRNGAQKMGELIDDLLTFSRLSRLPLSKRAVDTDKLVRRTLEELNFLEQARRVEVRIGALPPCLADSALLKQVWVNLLSNALKYTGKCPSALVEIGCAREKDQNVYFVRDNGTGFDMKYADKLFGVFQRFHRAEDYEGTGVGLAIVQRIITRHGGRVWAEAAVNCGATFYFTLEGEPKL